MSKRGYIYADGSCNPNPGPGGWGIVISLDNKTPYKMFWGRSEGQVTNNIMELRSCIEALKLVKEGVTLTVYTDSNYIVGCFNGEHTNGIPWYVSWRWRGWKTSKKEPVANRELWEELIALAEKRKVTWVHIRAGSAYLNDVADFLSRGEPKPGKPIPEHCKGLNIPVVSP